MQTSKEMYTSVYFNTYYWDRVAAHIVLRDHLRLPDPSWYNMSIPTEGYHYAMEEFMKLAPTITTVREDIFARKGNLTIVEVIKWCVCDSRFEEKVDEEKRFWEEYQGLEPVDFSVKKVLKTFGEETYMRRCGNGRIIQELARFIEDEPDMSIASKKRLAELLAEGFTTNNRVGQSVLSYHRTVSFMEGYLGGFLF